MDDTLGADLAAFDERLAKVHLRGQWTADINRRNAGDGPRPAGVPHVWKWQQVLDYLHEACQAFPETLHARRNLTFDNPALARYTTQTLAAGVQLIRPGEIAWPHRHTATALRFVVDGDPDLVTVVDGVAYPMEDYDLILTPNWCWHGHHNRSDRDVTWVDLLDVPLILALNQAFVEEGEIGRIEPDGGAEAAAMRIAAPEKTSAPVPVRFPWADTEAALRAAADADADPFDGVTVPYSDPRTGGPTLPTVSCHAHMLRPGETTRRHRHTASAIYFVIRGEGRTVVGDSELNWARHDTFCIPNWSWHHHVNLRGDEETLLFSIDDSPMLAAFGLDREETEDPDSGSG